MNILLSLTVDLSRKATVNCHVLVPDMESAAVVKEIFCMASRKININEIVRLLNVAEIHNPWVYSKICVNYRNKHKVKRIGGV